MSCLDSTCPCQDGDACHYEAVGDSGAWPACIITGIHRESSFRVGGSTICLDCRTKLTTCCEGAPQS